MYLKINLGIPLAFRGRSGIILFVNPSGVVIFWDVNNSTPSFVILVLNGLIVMVYKPISKSIFL